MSRLRYPLKAFDSVFACAMLSAVLYWASFAPLRFTVLVWTVPALWTVLIRQPTQSSPIAFYLKAWIAGTSFWLVSFHWILLFDLCVANLLWGLGSLFLAFFWVLFVGLSRTAVYRIGIPVILAAPITWCGLEWIRKNFVFGGVAFASLEHTQYLNTTLIQIADILGEYGVGMFIVFMGACFGQLLPIPNEQYRSRWNVLAWLDTKRTAVSACIVAIVIVLCYGTCRLRSVGTREGVNTEPQARIAVLQGKGDAPLDWTGGTDTSGSCNYERLSRQAALESDLVVWPETMGVLPLFEFAPGFVPDNWRDQPKQATAKMLQEMLRDNRAMLIERTRRLGSPLLVNVRTSLFEERTRTVATHLNSAVLIDPEKGVGPRYDKIKLVPFLEHNPFAPRFSEECNTFGCSFMSGGHVPAFSVEPRCIRKTLVPGDMSTVSPESLWAAVNICYDSTFPSFIRKQVNDLAEQGKEPDVLINMANDISFRFSSLVDMHMATHVFRAIENRKPYLSANYAGQSVWVDNTGRIIKKGEAETATYLVAKITRESTFSLYRYWGDWLPISCMVFVGFVIVWWTVTTLNAWRVRWSANRCSRISQQNGQGLG